MKDVEKKISGDNENFVFQNMNYYKVKKIIFFIGIFGLLVSCQSNNKTKSVIDNANQESCLICHSRMTGFSKSHNPRIIGCSSCHLGDVHSDDKVTSHKNMIKVPGNLSNASKTCGTTSCHKGELSRINNSLMSTNSGIVSIDKFAFGEVSHTDTFFNIKNINGSAADKHLKNLCFKCHLGYEKKHYSPVSQLSRGGGCLACHLDYNSVDIPDINDNIHPSLNLQVDDSKCFGCHSRSGRISLNYEGWSETLIHENIVKNNKGYRILDDKRVLAKNTEDIHYKAGMACIDCHLSQEIMGDGRKYIHESQALKVQCIDCHPKKNFKSIALQDFDSISVMDYALRSYNNSESKFIATAIDRIPMVNTIIVDSLKAYLKGKLNKKKYILNNISDKCNRDKVHKNLSCSMCHTSWAPTCIGCHTDYDPEIELQGGHKGKWYELVDDFGASKPVMGMEKNDSGYIIKPAIPGMIMTLDKSKFAGKKIGWNKKFWRLFAPVSAHTVSSSRSCESCHLNPQALGYGSGKLELIRSEGAFKWQFESEYENNKYDNLPQNSWIGFLEDIDSSLVYSAHKDFFPLNLDIQKRVLNTGACLQCHKSKDFKNRLLKGEYHAMIKNKDKKCQMPF